MTHLALFLHILGATTLYGSVLTAVIAGLAGSRRATFSSLVLAIPAWAVTLVCAYWIEHDEGLGNSNATWLQIGHNVLEPGLLVLLLALAGAYWWRRSEKPLAGRVVVALSAVYLLLLTVAYLAMAGKWGS